MQTEWTAIMLIFELCAVLHTVLAWGVCIQGILWFYWRIYLKIFVTAPIYYIQAPLSGPDGGCLNSIASNHGWYFIKRNGVT